MNKTTKVLTTLVVAALTLSIISVMVQSNQAFAASGTRGTVCARGGDANGGNGIVSGSGSANGGSIFGGACTGF